MPGTAIFQVTEKPAAPAREGLNPFTKEPMTFKARPASKVGQSATDKGPQGRAYKGSGERPETGGGRAVLAAVLVRSGGGRPSARRVRGDGVSSIDGVSDLHDVSSSIADRPEALGSKEKFWLIPIEARRFQPASSFQGRAPQHRGKLGRESLLRILEAVDHPLRRDPPCSPPRNNGRHLAEVSASRGIIHPGQHDSVQGGPRI